MPLAQTSPDPNPDQLCIDTIRTLAMDAVQKADSGHPGAPMALAPVIFTLWQSFLRFDPADSHWPDRDRFVLSNGHASMVLYAMLFLAGVRNADQAPLGIDDIKAFHTLGSRCPGHPEHGVTPGVETTTGPLGQAALTASAWPWPHAGRRHATTGRATPSSTTTSMPSAATAT